MAPMISLSAEDRNGKRSSILPTAQRLSSCHLLIPHPHNCRHLTLDRYFEAQSSLSELSTLHRSPWILKIRHQRTRMHQRNQTTNTQCP